VIGFLRNITLVRASAPAPETQLIEIDGRKIELRFKRNAKAKRMVLRLDSKNGGLVMTLPKRSSLVEALRFAQNSSAWIVRTLAKQKPRIEISDGAEILFRGEKYILQLTGGRRGLVKLESNLLIVPGEPEHAERRLQDYFKKQALADLSEASKRYAALMATKFSRVTIRDQKSRWGSCSATGALSYSWRLVLAPGFVLDYVAAHEVAHLLQMNHGPKFWRLVLTHCPHSRQAKEWLKKNGRELHSYL
jgi:predicted metal-dependent hydrolase